MRRFLACLALALCLAPPSARAGAAAGYLGELIGRAVEARLDERREWLDLVHYRPDLLGPGYTSMVDSPGFFGAPDGKTDPRAELVATLEGFFAPDRGPGEPRQHPQCARIARYRWLRSELGFDPARLPERPCPAFEAWYARLNPERLTLVFPAAYLNNPSSMFGHTLLRVDAPGQDERTRLLAYAINYGAEADPGDGMLFAVKGLTGLYRGSFSVFPYYEKVKQYSDLEDRDIWEYRLNLDREEIRRLMEHLWELDGQYFDYYFFGENCSYLLLALLDVARPGVALADRFRLWVIPGETVRAVVGDAGLVEEVVFRPSARTEIEYRRRALDDRQRRLMAGLAGGEVDPDGPEPAALDPVRRAAAIEVAEEVVEYRLRSGELTREEAAPLALGLLRARSRIPVERALPSVPAPAVRPDEGHRPWRFALGLGAVDGEPFQRIGLRGGYHGLLDPAGGYVRGAEIAFLDLELRRYQDGGDVALDALTLVEIQSVVPRDRVFRPVSWRLGAGFERLREEDGDAVGDLAFALRGGGGPSFEPAGGVLLSGFAEAALYAPEFAPEDWRLGLGPRLGLLWSATPRWRLHL
ncbi:MAG TPA: DUF4105 domain-containing protein, partial [Geminicoccaceae bacterium]|nr:DUF4105 domain-containing protein [Geminicoccaceae bacterium]